MNSILKDLWNGELAPDKVLCQNREYRQTQQLLVRAEKELSAHLDARGVELFAQFDRYLTDAEQIERELIFSSGFSLAVRRLLEVLSRS